MYEYRCLENIKKLYKYTGGCKNQQQYKDIIELSMVSTPVGLTDNSTMTVGMLVNIKKPSWRKSLSKFLKLLYIKFRTFFCILVNSKTKLKSISTGSVLCYIINKRGG